MTGRPVVGQSGLGKAAGLSKASRLVHIVDEVAELEGIEDLSLVISLHGFLDAGNAAAHACEHLETISAGGAQSPGAVVATFDIDALYDYRARRPAMSFVRDHYADFDAPRLLVRLLRDSAGVPYLLLRGPEPDVRWEGFCRAVREVVERFSVRRLVDLGAVPMAVPHTRPIAVTPHATSPELLTEVSPWRSELRIPSSAQALLALRMGEWGHDALGYVAHIPHYLAQMDYPAGAIALLDNVEKGARLTVDLSDLRADAEQREAEIERQVATNEEVAEVVRGLEVQYDTFKQAQAEGNNLLADETPLPTGEEIGRQFEQFLAGLEED